VVTLDQYQLAARDRLLAANEFGLFDEAGYGKSHPAIIAALEKPAPRLVTMPAYLIPQFAGLIRMVDPNISISTTLGDGKAAKTAALEANGDFVLASYNTWSTLEGNGYPRYPQLHTRRWGVYIFDESQRMRGHSSLWTQQVFKTRNVDCKNRTTPTWWLTGTPLVAGAKDVWSFLHHCDRTRYRSYWDWVNQMCVVTTTPWELQVGALRKGLEKQFLAMLREYSLRRLCRHHPELSKLEMTFDDIPVRLPPSVYTMLRALKEEYRLTHPDLAEETIFEHAGEINAKLRLLTTLPPTVSQPKLEAFRGYLEDHSNERIVVFAWHREVVSRALEVIQKVQPNRRVWRFDGDTSTKWKILAQDGFNQCDDGIIVATIAAMNAGVNLQAGHRCCFLEESYLPGENEQAVRRLLRRGQNRPVIVTRIRAADSIDETVWKQARKRGDQIRTALQEGV
jgi:SNF2-related domain